MNSLRYGTYNVANAFVDNDKTDHVLDEMHAAKVDICVLPEALPANHETVATRERFDRAGYAFHSVNNDDADGRLDARQTGIAVRRGAGITTTPSPIRLETRNAWYLPHRMPGSDVGVDYYGVHLNDRGNQERAVQIAPLKEHMSLSNALPNRATIIQGDINADYESTPFRRFCQFLGAVTRPIPESQPKKLTCNLPSPGRIRSIARRLDEETDGTTMRLLIEETGLYDADMLHQPTTKLLGFLTLALDRAMVSGNITAFNYKVAPQTVSDHRLASFSATIEN